MKAVLREILIFIVIVGAAYLSFWIDLGLGFELLFKGCPAYLLIRLTIWLVKVLIRYYRKLKNEQKPLVNKTTLSIGVPIIALLLAYAGYDLMLNIKPTAIVIDAETGKTVEGAIVLAQWYYRTITIPEGGSEGFDKAKESLSDKDGKVYIGGFWGLYIFSMEPRLAVYKPGYVLWDSRWLCPTREWRTDFDKNNRTVKLLKFEPEAARWLKEYPNRFSYRVGPRAVHDSFYDLCDLHSKKLHDAFRQYELPLLKKEVDEFDQKAKVK